MNQLLHKIASLWTRNRISKDGEDALEKPPSTAAVESPNKPEALHPGKRRLKESYTSHWDLDYLPRKEFEEIMTDDQSKPD